ncbi:hypothetical protein ADIARSV_2135 [Arcticibacter svalbardensis MN12-7]|uniref:Uncharacterized protein n=1 Tax=Arcticibacter svalbardensis MN12-7 TaxID=1150600 RepID=R9GSS8_9SPHI|nr:hypothetical protein [Arcticibacter svalbardensis]EOR94761.1 hypothetical protein ADIARSV_2135 [Arcticibacter svalbardensis MN12-7]
MNKSHHSVSPFIMLLIPALLAIILSVSNAGKDKNPEKYTVSSYFSVPVLKGVIQSLY